MRRLMGLFLAAVLSPLPASASIDWHETVSPHFVVRHEEAFLPGGLNLELEKLHNRLRMDLSMFAPWMAKERVKVFLYGSQRSYVRGEFSPPSWSNGIAMVDIKTVVSFEKKSRAKLLSVLSHELTHLFFEGYWEEVRKTPPTWVNEGLAMLEENGSGGKDEEKGDWFQSMTMLVETGSYPMESFVRTSPTKDFKGDQDGVTRWYVQAYSTVYFLYREHTRLQFFNFCKLLREGEDVEKALWKVYRFHTLGKFEAAWKKWLTSAEIREKLEYTVVDAGEEPASPRRAPRRKSRKQLRKAGFQRFHYDSLLPDR